MLVIRSLPMKHFISLISLISFTSLIIPTQPLAAQSELVTNGGFESFDGAGLGAFCREGRKHRTCRRPVEPFGSGQIRVRRD